MGPLLSFNVSYFFRSFLHSHSHSLQSLIGVILSGWPERKEDTPVCIREYWPIKEELTVQNDVIFKGHRVVIPKAMCPEMLLRIHASHLGVESIEVWDGKPTHRKSWAGNLLMCSVFTSDTSFKVKRV